MPEHIFEELAARVLRHHDQPQPAQETVMNSRIAQAQAAVDHAAQQLAAIPAHPLADAIADAGIGLALGPQEIALVLAMIRAIEHGPGQAVTQAEQQPVPPQQPIV